MGRDLQVYLNWDKYPIIVICVVGIVIGYLPMIVDTLHLSCLRKRRNLLEKIMFKVSTLIMKKEYELEIKELYYMPDQPRALKFFMRLTLLFLYQAAVIIGILATVTFWVVFLIEETFACDAGLDCFPFTEDGDKIQGHPIVNCSDFESADNITITCYRFVLKYAEGFGAAGGVLYFSAFVTSAFTSVVFYAAHLLPQLRTVNDDDDDDELVVSEDNIMQETGSCWDFDWYTAVRSWMGPVLFILTVTSVPVLCSFVTAVVVFSVDFFKDTILKTTSSRTQFVAYYISLQYMSIVPLPILTTYILKRRLSTHPSTHPANGSTSTSREKDPLLSENITTRYNT